MKHTIVLSRSARKQLERLADEIENRILTRLSELEANPRPAGCKN